MYVAEGARQVRATSHLMTVMTGSSVHTLQHYTQPINSVSLSVSGTHGQTRLVQTTRPRIMR